MLESVNSLKRLYDDDEDKSNAGNAIHGVATRDNSETSNGARRVGGANARSTDSPGGGGGVVLKRRRRCQRKAASAAAVVNTPVIIEVVREVGAEETARVLDIVDERGRLIGTSQTMISAPLPEPVLAPSVGNSYPQGNEV